jgi:cytochrome b561
MAGDPQVSTQEPIRRYSNWAVTFHWTTVVLVLAQAYFGFAFQLAGRGPRQSELFTWHKTLGALILIVTLARLIYRLVNPPPPYPSDLPRWEQKAATWNHRIFYVLLIAMPLAGLTAVSAHTHGPTTTLIGGIPFPVFPGVSESVGEFAGDTHVALVFVLILLILVHAAAALKHQFIDRLPAAGRMPPFVVPDHMPRVIGQGHRARPLGG